MCVCVFMYLFVYAEPGVWAKVLQLFLSGLSVPLSWGVLPSQGWRGTQSRSMTLNDKSKRHSFDLWPQLSPHWATCTQPLTTPPPTAITSHPCIHSTAPGSWWAPEGSPHGPACSPQAIQRPPSVRTQPMRWIWHSRIVLFYLFIYFWRGVGHTEGSALRSGTPISTPPEPTPNLLHLGLHSSISLSSAPLSPLHEWCASSVCLFSFLLWVYVWWPHPPLKSPVDNSLQNCGNRGKKKTVLSDYVYKHILNTVTILVLPRSQKAVW